MKRFLLIFSIFCFFLALSAAEVKQITNLANRKTDYPPVFEFQKAEPLTVAVTGSYSTEVEAGELTHAATKVLDRSEFDSHFGTTTKFGYAGKE